MSFIGGMCNDGDEVEIIDYNDLPNLDLNNQ